LRDAPRSTLAVLLLAALPVFFLSLGANSIWDANEAFYVETPRQMVLTGEYVSPSFNALERFNKPVLSYWIVAGLYHAFGISVETERWGIAIGAMGIVFAAFLLGRALGSSATGVLAALLIVTAPRIVFFARRIFIDVWITAFMSLALACFVLAMRDDARRRRYLALMYVVIGLGVLTKGPMAVLLPGAVVLAWLAVERRLAEIRRLMIVPGGLIVLAIAAPWWIAVGLTDPHGWAHVTAFFVGENVGRFASSMTGGRAPWFFLGVLFGDFLLPWAPLLAAVIVSAWLRRRQPDPAQSIRRLLWIWIAVIVGGFSLSASKEDLYIFSVVPAAAALIADALLRSRFGLEDRPIRIGLAVVAAGFAGAGLFVLVFLRSGYYRIAAPETIAAVLIACSIIALALFFRRAAFAGFVTLVAGAAALNYLFVVRVLPDIERLKPVPALAGTIRTQGSAKRSIGSCNVGLPSLVYYADQPLTELDGTPHALEFFRISAEPWVVMGEVEWVVIQAQVPGLCVRDRRRLFDTRISDVIRGTPPPEVLLVAKCR
jgi:4-amino-4-deoxy-L-arabinose transferase-like glycosyltransferase